MAYGTKILLDSIAPTGKRITTFELTYPRFVHAELMTHRLFSRNSASSRAIPVEKMLSRIEDDPAVPVFWGKNQKGMQAEEQLSTQEQEVAEEVWLRARDSAVSHARELVGLNVHKQIANRITEPWMFITVLLTATEFDNWWNLRCSPMAQPEIRWVAEHMRQDYEASTPQALSVGSWHTPLIFDDERENLDPVTLRKVSVGRCARVSYLTHDGRRDYRDDIALFDRLRTSGHWSPFEHVAEALDCPVRLGNFIGWKQYRKYFEDEHPTQIEPREDDVVLSASETRALQKHLDDLEGGFMQTSLDGEPSELISALEKLRRG